MSCRADDQRLAGLCCSAADFFDRARIAEIDRDVGILNRRVDRVPEIAPRDDVDLWIVLRQIENCLAHSTARSDQRHAHARFHFDFSNASSVLRNRAWFVSVISQSGKRTSNSIAPRQASAVFAGTGFGSMNKSLNIDPILR